MVSMAAATLACEICGEELLPDEMKTHFLLKHIENDMDCPLCSLSAVTFDELCFHISAAHPDNSPVAPPGRLLSPDYEAAKNGSDCSSGTAGETKEDPDGPSSAGEPALVTSALKTQNTEARRTFGRERPEDDSETVEPPSLPRDKLVKLACPMCSLVCSSYPILQEHVELHLQEQPQGSGSCHCAPSLSPSGETRLDCPMCSLVCSDSFSLQEHVELHLDQEAAMNSSGSRGLDLELARQLQEEENQRRRREETKQEKEEFKKLQRQFGVDGSGGYCRQMERAMERAVTKGLMSPVEFHCKKAEMMETLASGVDDGTTRTSSVVRALHEYYQTQDADCVHVWLSADTDHFCSSVGDKGWGCGYRNFQMLLSSLHRLETYAAILQEKTVPSIPQLQRMIEGAWKEGLDPQGASHFNQRLLGTRAWVGATEIFSLLTFLGISRIIDFHRPTGPADTHPLLFDWVRQYFSSSTKLPPRLTSTSLPPLYLQHHGHSCSIVGLEQKRNGKLCLLVLDPASSVSDTQRLLSRSTAATAVRSIRKFPGSLKHKQYQVVVSQDVLSAQERQMKISNSKILCAEKIP
ncbi:zinc finger-containing ubiquitin peptidase 1 isoform X2 [Takifugu rubripes]|uniref:zinc finger-containing ubiquitin peptidase 1 isoform X2 n=1 Tax=Takifugu rubripes TaxID=31033 RepID=UPI0011453E47|nr:zinc finger-containing ubiquitin peptidase 1 isoform X2 [Takifugu rubripes]